MAESINTVVVGAGVIGLACARALTAAKREVIVIDRNEGIGQETSSRNSEVIHAGIYYEPGSDKARFCVSGKKLLYAYCAEKGVPHRQISKLIVAPLAGDVDRLKALKERAAHNGVNDLRWLSTDEIKEIEPSLDSAAALHSPSTGIVDSHALMLALLADTEANGGDVALRSRLLAAENTAQGKLLTIESADETTQIVARTVINCAGLHASDVAMMLHGETASIPLTRYARGVYFEYSGKSPFSRLIYPLPEPGGLGVHATLDMSGALRFGPDVEWIDGLDYTVDPDRANAFAAAIRRWWPDLETDRLRPSYAGIRPKLSGPGDPPADFRIVHSHSGSADIIDMLGIESPGLTSALAIADYAGELLR